MSLHNAVLFIDQFERVRTKPYANKQEPNKNPPYQTNTNKHKQTNEQVYFLFANFTLNLIAVPIIEQSLYLQCFRGCSISLLCDLKARKGVQREQRKLGWLSNRQLFWPKRETFLYFLPH